MEKNWEKEFDEKFLGNEELDLMKPVNASKVKEFIRDTIFSAKIDVEMTESIKRYDQAKEDGTLDKHFPSL